MAMNERAAERLDESAGEVYAHLFQALAEPTRLAILQHLASGEHRVRDLVRHMGFAQSTVSKHLGFLAECQLVRARSAGRASWYSLAQPERLSTIITATEELLGATGARVVLCAHLRNPQVTTTEQKEK
ncbi:metalloregulator ArsR/SmtB family transcription factor [Microbacterium sp. SY138]|uniref:ArsR/SmtB family transcription factor n=1 Tax=unclassified Microbacterium TaxID=2609290 RepID=UPI00321B236D